MHFILSLFYLTQLLHLLDKILEYIIGPLKAQ
jgi:hypothetical protein